MENMQNIGNVNNLSTGKDVIGGGYTAKRDKDDSSSVYYPDPDSVSVQSYDNSVPYVDSLDDILASRDEDSIGSSPYWAGEGEGGTVIKEQILNITSKEFEEEMEAFDSEAETFNPDDCSEIDPEEQYYSDSNSQATDNHSFVQDMEEAQLDSNAFYPNLAIAEDLQSTPVRDRSPNPPRGLRPKSPKAGPVYGRSPRKVKFNDNLESHEGPSPQSRSMERALQRFQELTTSPPPLRPSPRTSRRSRRKQENSSPTASRSRRVLTPHHKAVPMSPRSPHLGTPPRYNGKSHSPSSSVGSGRRSSSRKSPKLSPYSPSKTRTSRSPRSSRRAKVGEKVGERVEFLMTAANEQRKRVDRIVPSPKSHVIKKNSPVLTKPEGPRLSTMAKLGVRKYSTSSPVDEDGALGRLYPGSPSPSKKIDKLKESATFSELKNMYLQDLRYCSPLRDRPVHRTTVPKPFSFQTDERAAFKRRITPMVESEENYDRQFKALPMPNYDNDPFFHAPKMWMEKNFTVPEPFQLSHMRMATNKYRKTRDDIEVGRYRFKALPVPDFSYKTLRSSHHIELTVPFPFHLSVDERFLNRIRFHGTKRSNMLARVHIACLLEKEKSSRDLMKDASDDSSKASRTSTISSKSMASNRRRRKENNIVESVEEIPRRQFKARPMPKFSKLSQQLMSKAQRPKSPAHSIRSNNESPGPASSAANDTLGSPGKRFKAKKMPDFSTPFAPRPKSPGHSIRSYPGTPSHTNKERLLKTRPKSPGHSIRSNNASSAANDTLGSPGKHFKAKKMPNFSKPFAPRPKSPGHSMRSNPGTPSNADKERLLKTRPKSPGHSIRRSSRTPSPASSVAGVTVASTGSTFKAKKMRDFSKPFVPRPRSPGHSIRSNPGTPSHDNKERLLKTRPKSPGHSIRSSSGSPGPSRNEKSLQSVPPINGPEDLLSVSKSPKTPRGFKAKKMPNFSKPFVPGKRSPHPADHSDQSVSTFATHDTTSGKSGRSRVSQSTSSFKAKAMPNFNKPFVPSKQEQSRSPVILKKNVDAGFTARPLPTGEPFSPAKRETSHSPVVLRKNSHFEARPMPTDKPFSPAKREISHSPVVLEKGSGFEARTMPNFSKPFAPLKRSSVEKALVKAVEDKNVLDILDRRLSDYKEKLIAGTQKSAPSQDPERFLKDMTDEVVHKVLQDFVSKAKSAQQEGGRDGGSQDFSLEDTLTDTSQEFGYLAIADISSDQISSETLSLVGAEQGRQSFGEDCDLSMASDNASDNSNYLSYSRSEDKDAVHGEAISRPTDQQCGDTEQDEECARIVSKTGTAPNLFNEHSPVPIVSSNEVQDDSLSKIDNENLHTNLDEIFLTENGSDESVHQSKLDKGLPPLCKNRQPLQINDVKNARIFSIFDDEHSDSGSTVMSDSQSLDANESAMPLLQVVDRLNLTMARLSQIELETESMISSERNAATCTTKQNNLNFAMAQTKRENNEFLKKSSYKGAMVAIRAEDKEKPTRIEYERMTEISETKEEESGKKIEVDTGDKNIELRSQRGNFGDDFGSDSDQFRAGWKRALEQSDIRDYPETTGRHIPESRIAALSVISEESRIEPSFEPEAQDAYNSMGYPSLPSPGSYDTLLSNNERYPYLMEEPRDKYLMEEPRDKYAITTYESNSADREPDDVVEKRREDMNSDVNRKVSIYDTIINCCSGKPASPTGSELNLLEDESRDDDAF